MLPEVQVISSDSQSEADSDDESVSIIDMEEVEKENESASRILLVKNLHSTTSALHLKSIFKDAVGVYFLFGFTRRAIITFKTEAVAAAERACWQNANVHGSSIAVEFYTDVEGAVPTKHLRVCGLCEDTTVKTLRDAFKDAIGAKIIRGKTFPTGVGYVKFNNKQACQKAKEAMKDGEIDGYKVILKYTTYTWNEKGTDLLVRNLPLNTTADDLKSLFSDAYDINLPLFKDGEKKKSRGFAFVAFLTQEQAETWLQQTQGAQIHGCTIAVGLASGPTKTLIVNGLCEKTTEWTLMDAFKGAIEATILTDEKTGSSKGVGFVDFDTEQACQTAKESMKDAQINGNRVTLSYGTHRARLQDQGQQSEVPQHTHTDKRKKKRKIRVEDEEEGSGAMERETKRKKGGEETTEVGQDHVMEEVVGNKKKKKKRGKKVVKQTVGVVKKTLNGGVEKQTKKKKNKKVVKETTGVSEKNMQKKKKKGQKEGKTDRSGASKKKGKKAVKAQVKEGGEPPELDGDGQKNTGTPTGSFPVLECPVYGMQVHKDLLYTCSGNKVQAFNLVTKECVAEFDGHTDVVNDVLVWSLPSKPARLYTCSDDMTVRCYNIKTETCLRYKEVPHRVLCLHIAFNILYVGADQGSVLSFDAKTLKQLVVFRGHQPDYGVRCLSSAWDGTQRLLLSGSYDGSVGVWDAWSGMMLHMHNTHTMAVLCMQVVADLVYSGSTDATVRAHNIHSGELVRVYEVDRHAITAINIQGEVMVTASLDGAIRTHNIQSGDVLHLHRNTDMVSCMMVHNDTIYSGCRDGGVHTSTLYSNETIGCLERPGTSSERTGTSSDVPGMSWEVPGTSSDLPGTSSEVPLWR